MFDKPSDKRIKIVSIFLISLIILAVILLVNSYFSIEKRINQSAEDYLQKTNEYAISTLEQDFDNYHVLLQEQFSELSSALQEVTEKKIELIPLASLSSREITALFLLSDSGDVISSINLNENSKLEITNADDNYITRDTSLNKFLENRTIKSGKEYFLNGFYYVNLYIQDKEKKQIIVATINLQQLYKKQIKNGEKKFSGYTMVKNENFVVIMHPSNNQINLNITTDRKIHYPDFDFEGLEKLEKKQKNKNEGIIYYKSYWWDQKNPKEVDKMSVFRWVDIGDSRWVVATNSDVKERKGLPIENLLLLVVLFILIVFIFILFYFILRQYQNQYKIYLKYHELKKRGEEDRIRHELEKKIQQESKLETIGIVTTTIVHDLNNILTPLLGMTKLMMEEHKTDEVLLSDLESIYVSAEKGQLLSRDILRFAKLDSKKKKKSDIIEIIEDGLKTIRPLIPKNISLELEKNNISYPKILIEPQDLQNMLFNLITNAYQAIGEKKGKIIISISIEKTDNSKSNPFHLNNKETIVIKVRDNGPGIPLLIQNDVLNTLFYTTKAEDGGTGLGLFVVTSLAKKYGWDVKLSSNTEGTIFFIRIPT